MADDGRRVLDGGAHDGQDNSLDGGNGAAARGDDLVDRGCHPSRPHAAEASCPVSASAEMDLASAGMATYTGAASTAPVFAAFGSVASGDPNLFVRLAFGLSRSNLAEFPCASAKSLLRLHRDRDTQEERIGWAATPWQGRAGAYP